MMPNKRPPRPSRRLFCNGLFLGLIMQVQLLRYFLPSLFLISDFCVLSFSLENNGDNNNNNSPHPMSKSSRLSHIMLKVPSVDDTAKYWTEKGGKIRMSKGNPTTDDDNDNNNNNNNNSVTANGANQKQGSNGSSLMSAFVELGCAKSSNNNKDDDETTSPVCFALELVSTDKKQYKIGNCISYIGVSMLLQFQNNLLGVIKGDEKPKSQGNEPNGLTVNSAASAPGDMLARIAFKSNNLIATNEFYTSILGMENKAQDEQMLCLRYDNDMFNGGGVPTTLIFDATTDKIDVGDCFDHLVVATKYDINDIYEQLKKDNDDSNNDDGKDKQQIKIFMNPTDMFGKQVMGVFDPNGYKIVICSV